MKEVKKEQRATIRVHKEDWETFKEICKNRETDASKELRKFMKRFISKYK